jgi:hypothetical protein
MDTATDFVLLQCVLDDPSALAPAAAQWCATSAVPMALHRAAWQGTSRTAYVYGRLAASERLGDEVVQSLAMLWARVCADSQDIRVSRLELAFDARGASQGGVPRFHYVVEMSPEDGWMDEISRWYDTEHMPGLAAVPGCIHARRLINRDHGPLSLACYDLMSEETLGSPPWLAVRGTAWSDITRPHFTNTKRTMMKVIA